MIDEETENIAISRRLKMMREAIKLSQAQLCREIGVAQNRWNQYETGERRITLDVALRLKRRFGVTRDWIYDGDISGMPHGLAVKLTGAPVHH